MMLDNLLSLLLTTELSKERRTERSEVELRRRVRIVIIESEIILIGRPPMIKRPLAKNPNKTIEPNRGCWPLARGGDRRAWGKGDDRDPRSEAVADRSEVAVGKPSSRI